MKKVLFVLQSIGLGGSMTSLINLTGMLKNTNLQYEMFFMDPSGELLPDAKKNGIVLESNSWIEAVTYSRKTIISRCRWRLLLMRLYAAAISKLRNVLTNDVAYKIAAKKFNGRYDCIVAFQEGAATNFVKYISAPKKIAWVHNDYPNVEKMYGSNERVRALYENYDKVVCVSKAGFIHMKEALGLTDEKVSYIYNTLPNNVIRSKAEAPISSVISDVGICERLNGCKDSDIVTFVSSGRFSHQKRFDRAVEVAKRLKKEGYRFRWIIIGGGALFDGIKSSIHDAGLDDCFILTGGVTNPFPIVRIADVFVLTSDFEAHPMVANEALILHLPVVSTGFDSAKEVVTDHKNGLVCDNSADGIYVSLKELFDSPTLINELKLNVCDFNYDNEAIVQQVADLLTGDGKA